MIRLFSSLLICFLFVCLTHTPAFGSSEATVLVSIREDTQETNTIQRGEKKVVGYIDLEAKGGDIDVERIALHMIGTADKEDVRRAKLYTEWGSYIASGILQEDIVTFSGLENISLQKGEKMTLSFEIEIGATATVGSTIGFRMENKNAVHVESQKYDKKYVELIDASEISPLTILDADTETLITASHIDEPEYKTTFLAGEKASFGSFQIRSFGKDDAIIRELTITKTGSIADIALEEFTLIKTNGEILAESSEMHEKKIIFENPFLLPANSSIEFSLEALVSSSASVGDTLLFEISNQWDIDAISSDEKPIENTGAFPLRTNTKVVSQSGVQIKLSSDTPESHRVHPGEKDVEILRFTIHSYADDMDISSLTLDLTGTGTGFLLHPRLVHIEDEVVSYPSSVSLTAASFENTPTQEAGNTATYAFVGDMADDFPDDLFLSASISSPVGVKTFTPKGKALPVSGAFPISGKTMTLGKTEEKNTLEVTMTSIIKNISEKTLNAPLAQVSFTAGKKDVEIEKMYFSIRGDADISALSNFRLLDSSGNIVSGPVISTKKTFAFTHPIPIPAGKKKTFTLFADVAAANQSSVLITMDKAPFAQEISSQKPITIIGDFPLSVHEITVNTQPDSTFVSLYLHMIPGYGVSRGDTHIKWGEISLGAHNNDIRIDRLILLAKGSLSNGLTNVKLVDTIDGREYPAKISDTSYIFEQPIRLKKNEVKTLSLYTDIRDIASIHSNFAFKISGSNQIIAKANGKEVPAIGHFPISSGLFSILPVQQTCSSEIEPVCGKKYDSCTTQPCDPIISMYDNICELRERGAYLLLPHMCQGEEEVSISIEEQESPPNSFLDIPQTHMNASAIEALRKTKVIKGFSDGTFRPEENISRAAFTKIVIGAQFSPEEIDSCITENTNNTDTVFFPDVPANQWFAPYVCVAKSKGIINGFPDGFFRPEKKISFAEAAKIVGIAFHAEKSTNDAWYEPFVEFLAEKKAIPTTITNIEKNITRGEMAEIIYRLRNHISIKASQSADNLLLH